MPTYEYVCSKCGHEFELFQKMSDPPKKKCPECSGKVTKKIGAGAGLIFKGSGFYITDYRSEGYKKAAQAEAGGASGGGKDAAAKKDSGGTGGAEASKGSGGKSGAAGTKSGGSSGTKSAD